MEAIKKTIDSNIVWKFCDQHKHLQFVARSDADMHCNFCGGLMEAAPYTIYFCPAVRSDDEHDDYPLAVYNTAKASELSPDGVAIPYHACFNCGIDLQNLIVDFFGRFQTNLDDIYEAVDGIFDLCDLVMHYLYQGTVVCPICPPKGCHRPSAD